MEMRTSVVKINPKSLYLGLGSLFEEFRRCLKDLIIDSDTIISCYFNGIMSESLLYILEEFLKSSVVFIISSTSPRLRFSRVVALSLPVSTMSSPSTSNLPSGYKNNQVSASTNDQSTNVDDVQTTGSNQITVTNGSALVNSKRKPAQFTRGEKCLFIHLIVTFGLLVLLFIIYVVHLYWVQHQGYDIFGGMMRMGPDEEKSDYMPVGVVYVLPDYYMCNCLLLRPRWSLAPAHCVAARSDPDLAYALPSWRITYGYNDDRRNMEDNEDYIETTIVRGVAHPHFNRDDFQNNIGLLSHEDSIHVLSFVSINDVSLNDAALMKNAADLKLIAWEDSPQRLHGHAVQITVQPLSSENCKQDVSPILDLRAYEYCVKLTETRNVTIAPGAVLAKKSEYLGMFVWGDSSGRHLPFIILDLAHYKNWILHVIAIYI